MSTLVRNVPFLNSLELSPSLHLVRACAEAFLEERETHVAPRTHQFENERLKPLKKYFGDKAVLRIKATDISRYQKSPL